MWGVSEAIRPLSRAAGKITDVGAYLLGFESPLYHLLVVEYEAINGRIKLMSIGVYNFLQQCLAHAQCHIHICYHSYSNRDTVHLSNKKETSLGLDFKLSSSFHMENGL